MTHRLRFLPLFLILAAMTVAVVLQPNDAAAQADGVASRGDARTERRADTALRVARRARRIGRRALAQATAVMAAAQDAQESAQDAQETADGANSRLDAMQVGSDSDAAAVSTAEETQYVDLGGPTVTATVPTSGLIEVWATVRFDDPSDGQVALFEDGQLVPIAGQEAICTSGGSLNDVLLSAQGGAGLGITLSTPSALIFPIGCGTPGAVPGPMLFQRTPGEHTYDLRYADCGCDPSDASFSERTLRVAGRE